MLAVILSRDFCVSENEYCMEIIDRIKILGTRCWALGFVRGGIDAVMNSNHLECDWVKMPRDRWFADPFVLDVTEKEILLLVEDFGYDVQRGVISLLHIDRATMKVASRKVLLELPTHLSFPAIWRKDGHIYVYPESAKSGKLDMYEYSPETEELTFVQTICDDVVWDSYITEAFGELLLFTAAHDDCQLDIYKWNDKKKRFVANVDVPSEKPNARLGGAVFKYGSEYYYPAQDCSKNYGGAIDIKRIKVENGEWKVEPVKHLESPHLTHQLGMHTLNEHKGVVVIDVHGSRHTIVGSIIAWLVGLKKKLNNRRANYNF